MPVLVGDVRRVASSVAIVEPIASRHLSPLTALRSHYRFQCARYPVRLQARALETEAAQRAFDLRYTCSYPVEIMT
jgi:hypothetical protein